MKDNLCKVSAVVVETRGEYALVQAQKAAECASCNVSLCGAKKSRLIKIKVPLAVKGETVYLEMPSSSLAFSAFWLYFAGICAGVIPAWLAARWGEIAAATIYLISVSLWIWASSILLNRYVKKRIKIYPALKN